MFVIRSLFFNFRCNFSCDLLKNIYLCGSNNNGNHKHEVQGGVVICLKISIFVVATTTDSL